MFELKISSALNTLSRINIDLGRATSLETRGQDPSLDMLKAQSEELGAYIVDFKKSYDELG